MATAVGPAAASDRQWFIVGRWQEYEGEARANLLRIVSIGAFYIVELVNYHGLNLGFLQMPKVGNAAFHQQVTALAVAWSVLSLAILLCLRRQVFPAALKFISTGADLVFLTSVLLIADGPRSPLVVALFLIVTLSGLRFNLPLVWFATGGALAAYLFVLGHDKWFRTTEHVAVPRFHQLIVLLAILLSGIVLGQVVRRVRAIAADYAQRLEASRDATR
jgi:hypothetical protein